jgi:hypothetical protein
MENATKKDGAERKGELSSEAIPEPGKRQRNNKTCFVQREKKRCSDNP